MRLLRPAPSPCRQMKRRDRLDRTAFPEDSEYAFGPGPAIDAAVQGRERQRRDDAIIRPRRRLPWCCGKGDLSPRHAFGRGVSLLTCLTS